MTDCFLTVFEFRIKFFKGIYYVRHVKEYRCVAGLAFSSLHILTYDSSLLLVTVSNIRLFLVLARHDHHRSRLQPGEYLLAVCTRSANQRAAPGQSTNEVSVFVSYDTEVARILTQIITVLNQDCLVWETDNGASMSMLESIRATTNH